MGLLNFNNNFNISLPKINLPKISFGKQTYTTSPLKEDSYSKNSATSEYFDESRVQTMVASNPKITSILAGYGLTPKINLTELKKLALNHLNDTKNIALGIYDKLPEDIKTSINKINLIDAAMLHDFGKVLIPNEILNKNSSLNDKEKEVMQLHSELGYEMLQTQDIDPETLKLIKYHHQNSHNTGYPKIQDLYEHNFAADVLHAADVYSALRENRCYKKSLSPEQALSILKQEVSAGTLNNKVYSALENYVTKPTSN
ncbi:HD domain-containing protein [bacterium]|nr:HD domain-containing protein [bacterium]